MSKTKSSLDGQSRGYKIFVVIVLALLAVFFIFPLYWILTGSLKDAITINAQKPQWFPLEPTLDNYVRLFKQPAIQWLLNTIIIAVAAMALTCITAALAGYALAKKRFWGQTVLFSLLVCAMALPKQVIVIPLLQEMSALGLNNNLLAVILPTVGWPFGIFLMKQFSETIPTEMLEAARIDGASEVRTFVSIVFPMVKPGVGALAIFTFVNTWNEARGPDHLDRYRPPAGRSLLRLRPHHGRRGPGGHPHRRGLPHVPEVLHPGHHHGRRQGLTPGGPPEIGAFYHERSYQIPGRHPRLLRLL